MISENVIAVLTALLHRSPSHTHHVPLAWLLANRVHTCLNTPSDLGKQARSTSLWPAKGCQRHKYCFHFTKFWVVDSNWRLKILMVIKFTLIFVECTLYVSPRQDINLPQARASTQIYTNFESVAMSSLSNFTFSTCELVGVVDLDTKSVFTHRTADAMNVRLCQHKRILAFLCDRNCR